MTLVSSALQIGTSPPHLYGHVVDHQLFLNVTPPSFHQNNSSYSRVCGRITAIQRGSPDAFGYNIINKTHDIESAYVDGVSLTHGAAGSRQHIWTFVAALNDGLPNPNEICSCTRSNVSWPLQVPSFIADNYFCATGNPGAEFTLTTIYQDDPLWDGEGCGPTNACCEFNSPPWFCTTLPEPTSDDIEVRICLDQESNDEDILVTLVDIYAM